MLYIDDDNVNVDVLEIVLVYLYGYYLKFDDSNVFWVFVVGFFLDF